MNPRYSDLIIRLATGISQRRLYFDRHPRFVETCREVAADIAEYLRLTGAASFSIGVHKSKFVSDGCYLVGPSIAGRALIAFAERLACGGFSFSLPLEPEHLTIFFRLGAARGDASADVGESEALFEREGIGNIGLLALLCEDGGEPGSGGGQLEVEETSELLECTGNEFSPLLLVYQSMYEAVAGNTLAVAESGTVDLDGARQAGSQLVGMSNRGALDMMQFLRYPDYDSYTIGHSVRVAALASMLGRSLGWPEDVLVSLATAGLLHDLGKGRIPREILFKPGRLDEEQRRVIETHPSLGARLLLENGESDPIVVSATWGHHLRYDGGGYPATPGRRGRPGIVAEVIHVCDVFEALTARRPYKRALPPRQAFEIMLKDESAFHPRVLAKFITEMGLYPPGSQVLLSDYSVGVVVARGPALDRPCVRLINDAHGRPIPREHRQLLDLRDRPDVSVVELITVGTGAGDATDPVASAVPDPVLA